jgi:hypothetical protein
VKAHPRLSLSSAPTIFTSYLVARKGQGPCKRRGGLIVILAGLILQIYGDRFEVGVGHMRGRPGYHLGHQTCRGAGAVMSGLQIGCDFVDRPIAESLTRVKMGTFREFQLYLVGLDRSRPTSY